MSDWKISPAACRRWVQYVHETSLHLAPSHIQANVERTITVPNRLACDLWVPKVNPEATAPLRRKGVRYRFSPRVVFITRGHKVLTLAPTTDGDLATVLVWLMLSQWVCD